MKSVYKIRNSNKYFSLQEELKMYKVTPAKFIKFCHKTPPTSILMPFTQTQTSLPLSDGDLQVLKHWVFEIALGFLLLGVQIPLNGYNPLDIGGIISLANGLSIGGNFVERLNYVVGDIVVVWRAWVLFPQRLPVKVTLSICLLGSFVGASLDIGLLVKGVLENPSYTGNKTEGIILAVPLIFTNFTATALIGFKAWHHFKSIQRNLGSTKGSPSKVLKILLLLIESGLLYLAFWVISVIGYLVLGLTQDGRTTAIQAYLKIMPELVAIYPILIILAVAHENSKPESVNDMSLSQSIRFASVQASKSEDHHSESEGESQLVFPENNIDNTDEVERNEIEVLPRLS
ncbi:hypothetical protein K435DRAFT_805542 [Dendrothele bispora CBS 962.96]|uniref:Uncharacterized protein n=1 Tax=Dendrothele bispora (strain CBS 962.96) TaxID=1314807 RepID=A0A4S8LC39_DENBC|nr:hypothetical protein K435DRAFT_805542 [Dendrothele bispora CBS 962.96]